MKSCLFFLALIAAWPVAQAADLGDVASVKPLLRSALEDPEGRAAGRLSGPMAEKARAQFPGGRGILLEARVVQRFRRDGCARFVLRVAPEVVPEGSPRDMTLNLNWCRDGSLPDPSEVRP